MTGKGAFGLPYAGSKRRIAARIVGALPPAETFVDLFAGGGAVTVAAMLSGKYRRFVMNDIDAGVIWLFRDAVAGRYRDERRWIGRDDFLALKDTDPYVRICWSFGNGGDGYLYCREIEPYKRAYHHAAVLGDYALFREFHDLPGTPGDGLRRYIAGNEDAIMRDYAGWYKRTFLPDGDMAEIGAVLGEIEREEERLRRYLVAERDRNGLRNADVDRFLGTNGMAGHYYCKSQWEFPTAEAYERLDAIMHWSLGCQAVSCLTRKLEGLKSLRKLESLKSLRGLESLQNLRLLRGLESLEGLEALRGVSYSSLDYREVGIPDGAVVYCDIPYDTGNKSLAYARGFDKAGFCDWTRTRGFPVYVSEYAMPDDFRPVLEIPSRSFYSATVNKAVTERLFVR